MFFSHRTVPQESSVYLQYNAVLLLYTVGIGKESQKPVCTDYVPAMASTPELTLVVGQFG
jgi:hypothetical protein